MSKKSWIALIVLIVVAALIVGVFVLNGKKNETKTDDNNGTTQTTETKAADQTGGTTGTTEAAKPAAKYTFTLEIVHKDGQKKTTTVNTDEEILGEYLEKAGIIEGAEGQYGMYIAKVEGEKAVYEEDNAYWAFYIDGEYALTGVDQTNIESGKVYQLKYEAAY